MNNYVTDCNTDNNDNNYDNDNSDNIDNNDDNDNSDNHTCRALHTGDAPRVAVVA